jgi:hypothetical protein
METKICAHCKEEKSIDEFHTKGKENRRNSWCKNCVYTLQRKRWRDRKRKAVELMGGKCQKCGYNKNLSCFDFHHLDPSQKEVGWNKMRQWKWDKTIEELKKCILLCRNCHGEIHNIETFLECHGDDNKSLNKNIITIEPTGECPSCGKDVYGTKYCCLEYSAIGHRKVKRPSKKTLIKMIKDTNYSEIGRRYGVSDNAVRKWAKNYNII